MICEQCHRENRQIAKFCKWCGKPLIVQDVLNRMIGLDDVKQQLKTVVDTYTYLHSRKDIMKVRLSVNAIIIGETGTGKTALAEVIRDYFYQHKIIDKPKLTMVDAVDYQRFVDKWDTPILCIHGEKDYRINANQGMGAFNAARLRGIPAELLIFPDENHWVLKPQNGILWQRTYFDWLKRWLK